MKHGKTLIVAGLLFGFNAQAALNSYNTNGVNLVYSSLGNLTWTQNGNLLGTLEASNPNLVDTIISSIGSINDTPNSYDTPSNSGHHALSAADFGENGKVSWFGAQAFIKYLNNTNYAGSNQWRLPGITDIGAPGCNDGPIYAGSDCGYNVNTTSGEMAQLYSDELGAKAYYDTSGQIQSDYGIFGNNGGQIENGVVEPFVNVQSFAYWSGTESRSSSYASGFSTDIGFQFFGNNKIFRNFAWAVSPGQVSAVPVPSALWLFGSAILGFVGVKRRTLGS